MLLRCDFTKDKLGEGLQTGDVHALAQLIHLCPDSIHSVKHLLILERLNESLQNPDIVCQETMGLLRNVLDLFELLVGLEQLAIGVFDERANSLVINHFAHLGEVKSGYHVPPVFSHELSNVELVCESTWSVRG